MGSNGSIPIRFPTDPGSGSGAGAGGYNASGLSPSHPQFGNIVIIKLHQISLLGYIRDPSMYSDNIREAMVFTHRNAGHLDSRFNSSDLSTANVNRAHMLLALHKHSLEFGHR